MNGNRAMNEDTVTYELMCLIHKQIHIEIIKMLDVCTMYVNDILMSMREHFTYTNRCANVRRVNLNMDFRTLVSISYGLRLVGTSSSLAQPSAQLGWLFSLNANRIAIASTNVNTVNIRTITQT